MVLCEFLPLHFGIPTPINEWEPWISLTHAMFYSAAGSGCLTCTVLLCLMFFDRERHHAATHLLSSCCIICLVGGILTMCFAIRYDTYSREVMLYPSLMFIGSALFFSDFILELRSRMW